MGHRAYSARNPRQSNEDVSGSLYNGLADLPTSQNGGCRETPNENGRQPERKLINSAGMRMRYAFLTDVCAIDGR